MSDARSRDPLNWVRRVDGLLLVAYGTWTLPLGYFVGFNTSSYPTMVKLALGGPGIAAGIGVLRRRPWGSWLGSAFLMTQLVSLSMPGFDYESVFSVGARINFPLEVGVVTIQINVLALLMIVGLLSLVAQPAPAARDA